MEIMDTKVRACGRRKGVGLVRTTLWVTVVTSVVAALLVFKFTGSWLFPVFLGVFAYQAWKRLQERGY